MARRKKKGTLRATLIYLSIIAVLSLLAYMNRHIEHFLSEQVATFEVKNIKIHGNRALTRSQILLLCGVRPGEKFVTLKPVDIARKLLQSPFVKSASAVYSLPSTLHINVVERQPIAFVYDRQLLLLDEQGVVLPLPKSPGHVWNLPFIYGFKGSVGAIGKKTVSADVQKAIEVLQYVRFIKSPLWPLIAALDVSDAKTLQLSLTRGGARVRLNYDQYQDELYVLTLYIENYLSLDQLAEIEYIDLRFKDRLIVKNKKKQG